MATWVRRQHAEPLNEKNERLSAPLLRTHLHAVGFHYGWRVSQELQDSVEPPFSRTGTAPPIRPTRLIGSLVRWTPDFFLCQGFLAPPHHPPPPPPPPSASIFHGTIAGLPARGAGYRECLKLCFLLLDTITVQRAHLKASAERIRAG